MTYGETPNPLLINPFYYTKQTAVENTALERMMGDRIHHPF
jgi:hypothetical protein